VNQHARYIGEKSFSSKVIVRTKQTHCTDCSIWTTKVVGEKRLDSTSFTVRLNKISWHDWRLGFLG